MKILKLMINRGRVYRANCGDCKYLNRSKKDEPCCRCDRNNSYFFLSKLSKVEQR